MSFIRLFLNIKIKSSSIWLFFFDWWPPFMSYYTLAFRIQKKHDCFGIPKAGHFFSTFSLPPRPTLKKRHIEKWLAFSIPKTTSSFGYKKQGDSEVLRQKQSYWRWLDFGIKKTDTYSQGYYCQTKTFCYSASKNFRSKLFLLQNIQPVKNSPDKIVSKVKTPQYTIVS